jgi:hypothetical protein
MPVYFMYIFSCIKGVALYHVSVDEKLIWIINTKVIFCWLMCFWVKLLAISWNKYIIRKKNVCQTLLFTLNWVVRLAWKNQEIILIFVIYFVSKIWSFCSTNDDRIIQIVDKNKINFEIVLYGIMIPIMVIINQPATDLLCGYFYMMKEFLVETIDWETTHIFSICCCFFSYLITYSYCGYSLICVITKEYNVMSVRISILFIWGVSIWCNDSFNVM